MKKLFVTLGFITLFSAACDQDKQTAQTQPSAEPETVVETPVASEAAQPAAENIETETAVAEAPAAVVEEAPVVAAMTGEQVFKKHCFACHMTGAANAPKVGDAAAWEPRIAKGMEALVLSAINGVPGTAMQPKGTCASCSEDELLAAINFMIDQSR